MQFDLAQESVKEYDKSYQSSEQMKSLCKKAITEGVVLLENDGSLPLRNQKVSVFGRCQINTFYAGYGSGGDVKTSYKISIIEGLLANKANINLELLEIYKNWTSENVPDEGTWGTWPLCFKEMPIDESVVSNASLSSDVALVVIGRSAGEDRDIKLEDGSWYLNDDERKLLSVVRKHFNKMVILVNCGSIFDFAELKSYKPNALLVMWQAGQETGLGVAEVLLGISSPSGKLTSTVAKIEDYPSTSNFGHSEYNVYQEDIYVGYRYFNSFRKEKIIYPFGYGLSYSKFKLDLINLDVNNKKFMFNIKVKNIGNYFGKEVTQIYLRKPSGSLGNPDYELVGFKKTKLLDSNEEDILNIIVDLDDFAMFNEIDSYILEKGVYKFYLGNDSINLQEIYEYVIDEDVLVSKTNIACLPQEPFLKLRRVNNELVLGYTKDLSVDLKHRILSSLPKDNNLYDTYYFFDDVVSGKISLDEFVNSLSFDELEALTRGSLYSMDSPFGPKGNAGTFGASDDNLFKRGIKAISTNDGPSGARLACTTTLVPNGILLASTFNPELINALAYEMGKEVRERKSHVLLAPGINILRNPLCGRNFEYYSEDPYLTGVLASAYVCGVQKANVSACPKHFACNNQEFNRHINNSILDTRALREIYLKPFEICIKNAKPEVLMTSYNKINGIFSYYNYDLVKVILRDEFIYDGLIITDWWMRDDESLLFKDLYTQAYRIRATVDVYMPGCKGLSKEKGEIDGTLKYSYEKGSITLAEIRYCAKNVLKFILKKYIDNNI